MRLWEPKDTTYLVKRLPESQLESGYSKILDIVKFLFFKKHFAVPLSRGGVFVVPALAKVCC